jgi:protein-L-isoaspartate(D-aspartate) O-methyltransferase
MKHIRISTIAICVLAVAVSCSADDRKKGNPSTFTDEEAARARTEMVELLKLYGIKDERTLRAMETVRRDRFLPAAYASRAAYGDHPLPIGHEQTISQPYIVAYMTEQIAPKQGEKILEIGTGSGYQAAILAEMGSEVWTIEIVAPLAEHARKALASEGYENVKVRHGDGYQGWPEFAPFDAIIVTCAPEAVPKALVEQLREGGRMILPLGGKTQRLVILRKKNNEILEEEDIPVRFVPMIRKSH